MYLKSIEVQGFKSFANKIKFEFHNGITGIVGPNGSGKSNVADAVRWVLGEQRIKQLRGGKMEDVIFSGTQNRKPLGFAYVAITFDNKDHKLALDYDQVTVSRRLFRSGESEYMINGSVCRLRDVNEMFFDTGIGKEGYSIIGQGQIDKILSGKPEERRELFDEAAGIVKFKKRKSVAIKKLEEERGNLTRVNDILSELEKQVKPLERQSEKAREFLKLKEELKLYDINMFLLSMGEIRSRLKDADDKLQVAGNQLQDTTEEFEHTKQEYEKLELFIEEMDDRIEEKKLQVNQLQLLQGEYAGEIRLLQEQMNSSQASEQQFTSRIGELREKSEALAKEKEQLVSQKEAYTQQLKQAQENSTVAGTRLSQIQDIIAKYTQEMEDAKNDIIELLNEKASIASKMERYDTMLEQIQLRKSELNQKLIQYKSDQDAQTEVIVELKREQEKIQTTIEQLHSKSQEFSQELQNIYTRTKELNQENEKNQQQFHMVRSQLDSLRNMTERYEGYGNSIRKIMELRETKKGIIGVVADIIKVKKEYEVAVETALGGSIQNIVTDTESTAKDAIEYLKKGKFGRATFLPLTSIKNKTGFTNEQVLSEKGVVGLACDLVSIQKEYENIAKYLLGRIVVVDKIDHALSLARKYKHTLRIVTLEGELLHPGGSMSGGAFKNSSNLLGRRREIDELKGKLETVTKRQQECKDTLEKNRIRKNELTNEMDKINEVLQEQVLLQNTVELNLRQADEKQQAIEDEFSDSKKEEQEISSQIQEIHFNHESLGNVKKEQEEKSQALEMRVRELNGLIEKEKSAQAKENISNEESRMRHSKLQQQLQFLKENKIRIEKEQEETNSQLAMLSSQLDQSREEIKGRQQQAEVVKQALEQTKEKAAVCEQELTFMQKEREEQTREHKDFFQKRESLSEKMSQLDKEIYRLNSQKEKLEESNDSQINYMWDEYEMTYSNAIEYKSEKLNNLSELQRLVPEWKGKIRALGDVNVNAIEDYKEVSERYEFLNSQHADLIKAEENLVSIIQELDAGMKRQFMEKFEEIKVEFDNVFKELFGGGKGTLELAEDEDILEAGIRIISQPPGKKLQNMMQLSGGEKALTAISLLFAIQNLKPSPFCLLDEIEAALDDSNVTRFAGYLHKLTKYTQFIVITHRRGTMAKADRLYGITMQEKGVSTLVSVDLLDDAIQ